ncbi:class I fructose-bisphosphate aldolase, partial [Chamaesiphon sp. OTE_20_metabat_361]|uniref:class I fructose-bisphosphate aldolase n=1 Tax=Chamaesiphon sp. OTE_20_metabat_361 TaxID=2964689 RepID=UPI00286AF704
AFLSGGQSIERATAHLNLINAKYAAQCPWTVTFSYARAIQQPTLDYWHGDDTNIPTAQQMLLHRAKLNSAARQGKYTPEME